MPEYLTPGVYVEETDSRTLSIEGVSTSTAGFVGLTERGPDNPQLVTSWEKYQRIYGGPGENSFLHWAIEGFFLNGGRRCYVARIVASDGHPQVTDYVGTPATADDPGTGLAALESIEHISLITVPDEVRSEPADLTLITQQVIAQCERSRYRFALTSTFVDQRNPAAIPTRPVSSYAACYHPWIKVLDSTSNSQVLIPPTGHVAGIYVRTDRQRGVHKAPANEIVHGALDLKFPVSQADQELLNSRGINCLRDFRSAGRGIRVWGARTMSNDPEWRYVNVRRLLIFLEESIHEGTQWVVFEPNDARLWQKVRHAIESFLFTQWRRGAFRGVAPREAFFVRCDRTTMSQADLDSGRMICIVGVAPLKPAEFVILSISQKTAEAT